MNTVREFAADDAHIIFGVVYDESMGEEIRVTVVATGLGQAQARRQSFEVVNTPVMQATGTDGGYAHAGMTGIDYGQLDAIPAVVRKVGVRLLRRWPTVVLIATISRRF